MSPRVRQALENCLVAIAQTEVPARDQFVQHPQLRRYFNAILVGREDGATLEFAALLYDGLAPDRLGWLYPRHQIALHQVLSHAPASISLQEDLQLLASRANAYLTEAERYYLDDDTTQALLASEFTKPAARGVAEYIDAVGPAAIAAHPLVVGEAMVRVLRATRHPMYRAAHLHLQRRLIEVATGGDSDGELYALVQVTVERCQQRLEDSEHVEQREGPIASGYIRKMVMKPASEHDTEDAVTAAVATTRAALASGMPTARDLAGLSRTPMASGDKTRAVFVVGLNSHGPSAAVVAQLSLLFDQVVLCYEDCESSAMALHRLETINEVGLPHGDGYGTVYGIGHIGEPHVVDHVAAASALSEQLATVTKTLGPNPNTVFFGHSQGANKIVNARFGAANGDPALLNGTIVGLAPGTGGTTLFGSGAFRTVFSAVSGGRDARAAARALSPEQSFLMPAFEQSVTFVGDDTNHGSLGMLGKLIPGPDDGAVDVAGAESGAASYRLEGASDHFNTLDNPETFLEVWRTLAGRYDSFGEAEPVRALISQYLTELGAR